MPPELRLHLANSLELLTQVSKALAIVAHTMMRVGNMSSEVFRGPKGGIA